MTWIAFISHAYGITVTYGITVKRWLDKGIRVEWDLQTSIDHLPLEEFQVKYNTNAFF